MENQTIRFLLGWEPIELTFSPTAGLSPTTTVLQYLRSLPSRKGVKEGCGQGDCGACTVVLAEVGRDGRLHYQALNSCLLLLPMVDHRQLICVEDLTWNGRLHPVQEALISNKASQCGFCTPGIVMAAFALWKSPEPLDHEAIRERMSGNLCRCTGYRPIVEALQLLLPERKPDHFSEKEEAACKQLTEWSHRATQLVLHGPQQVYRKPVMLREALQIKEDSPVDQVVSGATDFALRLTKHREHISSILDISDLEELKVHDLNPNGILLGAGLNLNQAAALLEKPFPPLARIIRKFGSYAIRNRATIGGNIATASPIGDMIPGLLAYQASVILENSNRRKKVRLEEFLRSYRRTFIHPDELITAILIPFPSTDSFVWCRKVSKREEVDISTVSAGFCLEFENGRIREARLFFGGMADMVRHARKTELFLFGKPFTQEVALEAGMMASEEFEPLSDARSTSLGRKLMARNLILACFLDYTAGVGKSVC